MKSQYYNGMGKKRNPRYERLFVLNEPTAPRLNPALATEVGLNESIVLLQLEFLVSISDHFIEGKRWTFQSINDLRAMFPFWCRETINRAIVSLERQELIVVGNYNRHKYDKTRWFALNPAGIQRLKSVQLADGDVTERRVSTPEPHEPPVDKADKVSEGGCLENRQAVSEIDRLSQGETRSGQNETTIPETTTEITSETTPEDLSKLRRVSTEKSSPVGSPCVDEPYSDAIAEYMEQLSVQKLHDEPEHTQSNVTNALNRWRESGLTEAEFLALMGTAAREALQHTAMIKKSRKFGGFVKNRAPYFFGVLKDQIAQHPHAARAY